MNPCEAIEAKLICGERLEADEQVHLEHCAACLRISADLERIVRAGEPLAAFGEAGPEAQDQVQAAVLERIRSHPRRTWLGWAVPAVAAGLTGILLAWSLWPGSDPAPSGEAWLSLMDEVEQITSGDELASAEPDEFAQLALLDEVERLTAGAGDEADLGSDLFGSGGDDPWEPESDFNLPGGYQLLRQALDERWL